MDAKKSPKNWKFLEIAFYKKYLVELAGPLGVTWCAKPHQDLYFKVYHIWTQCKLKCPYYGYEKYTGKPDKDDFNGLCGSWWESHKVFFFAGN